MAPLTSLSAHTRGRLVWQIEGAFLGTGQWRVRFREAVRTADVEMRRAGATTDEIRDALAKAVREHPARGQLDRPGLTSGQPHSEWLIGLMKGWTCA